MYGCTLCKSTPQDVLKKINARYKITLLNKFRLGIHIIARQSDMFICSFVTIIVHSVLVAIRRQTVVYLNSMFHIALPQHQAHKAQWRFGGHNLPKMV